ncbi:Xaa-Pro dipeptidase [Pontibacterium sp.]|uniref:Xaa-Pro dipeptidase n=1 Tax=Pontibacterium sp. TaxID=2036026 RepID=UPI003511DDF3
MQASFFQHIEALQQRTLSALESHGFSGLLIGSGVLHKRFRDDNYYPFRANPQFLQWLPFLSEQPDCWLLVRAGSKPKLFYYLPTDFWHLTPALPSEWWCEVFEIVAYSDMVELRTAMAGSANLAVNAERQPDFAQDSWALNPDGLNTELDFHRAVKSEWELHCLREANRTAVKGHIAAESCFRSSGSEYEIHQTYLQAVAHNERDMPYDNIVALNEHAAVLHYQFQQRQAPQTSRTLLLDAGANHLGYAADITRTFTAPGSVFADLVHALDLKQKQLLKAIGPGKDFVVLHRLMHTLIAEVLQAFDLVKLDPEAQIERGITSVFFPHGLGHLLGLQVHDVGGWQQDAEGNLREPPKEHPFLRLTRTLEPGQVVTIEPGLYFIPSLLEPLRNSGTGSAVNWSLVDELTPYGGIRIEDNVAITPAGIANYTRDAFAAEQRPDL